MNTKKLAVFVDLAKTQNYSRSAERLFLSQSTISKYIIDLEKEWQVKLFIRAHRQVQLTSAGKLILPHVQEILEKEDKLNLFLTNQLWQQERPLVIKGLPSLSQYYAFKIITEFTKKYPKIKLKFSEEGVDYLEHALDHKNVDIIFTRIFENHYYSYDTITNEQDQLVVLIPKDNKLSQEDYVTVDMIKDESILLLSDTISKTNPLFDEFQSIQPQITYNGQRIDLILEMLNQGSGISIIMNKSFDLTGLDNIAVVPLMPKVTSQMAFMKRTDNKSAVVELFWKFADKETKIFMNNKNA